MPGTGAVQVEGLRELNAAFKQASRFSRTEFRKIEREIAEPVRSAAEELAVEKISHIGLGQSHWWQMRIGVTNEFIYVAPKQRGKKTGPQKRRNLAPLLMDKAMQPALDMHAGDLERLVDDALDQIAFRFNH
jgi:hypothetical protein